MSNGLSTPPRAGSAEARAMTMNEVQMVTVTTAAITPTALGDSAAKGFLNAVDIAWIIGEGPVPCRAPDNPAHAVHRFTIPCPARLHCSPDRLVGHGHPRPGPAARGGCGPGPGQGATRGRVRAAGGCA